MNELEQHISSFFCILKKKKLIFFACLIMLGLQDIQAQQADCTIWMITDKSDNTVIAFAESTDTLKTVNLYRDSGELQLDLLISDKFRTMGYPYFFDIDYYYKDCLKNNCVAALNETELTCFFAEADSLIYAYLSFGIVQYPIDDELSKKYGIIFINSGCEIHKIEFEYMQVVKRILNKRNGLGWEKKYFDELKSSSK